MADYMNLFNAMSQTGEMLQNRRDRENQPPIEWEVSSGKDGRPQASVTMDAETAMNIHKAMENYGQIVASMQQEVGRIQAQEDRQRRGLGPLMSVLSTVSGELAQDRRLPPVVSALGRANLALNPTPQVLAQQRLDILGQMGELSARGLSAAESGMRMRMEQERVDIDRQRLEQTGREHAAALKERQRERALQAVRLIAQKGGGAMSQEAFAATMRSYDVSDPEIVRDAYMSHQEMAGVVSKSKEAEQERKLGQITTREDLNLRNRIASIHESFALRTSPNMMAFQAQLHKLKKDIDNSAMSDRELKVIGQKDLQKLTQANATDAYVDKVEYMFNQPEWKAVAGPVFQFNPKGGPNGQGEFKINPQAALPKAFQNIPRTQADSMISHEIPRLLTLMLNGQAGGASILRIEAGQKLIRDMGVTGSVRPDQIQAIMKIVRDTNNENKAAVMRTHSGVDWSKRKWLLSSDTPQNRPFFYERKTSWGSPVQPIPPLEGGAEVNASDPLGVR